MVRRREYRGGAMSGVNDKVMDGSIWNTIYIRTPPDTSMYSESSLKRLPAQNVPSPKNTHTRKRIKPTIAVV